MKQEIAAGTTERERRPGKRLRRLLGLGLGMSLVWGAAGCHKTGAQSANDPANANMASPNAQVLGQNEQVADQAQGEDYSQPQGAPIVRQAPQGYYDPNAGGADQPAADQQAEDAYVSDLTDEQASEPPPPLPDYEQPADPDPNYIWTPGYWAWGPYGYYWVPGAWVEPPYVGALWTPGYWGWVGGFYRFHHGFWGLHIGFYGGINYGCGYTGYGYDGGYWRGNQFYYNTVYNRVNANVVRNVYVYNGGNARFAGGVSYNGGRGGLQARPRPAEIAVLHEQRNAPMAAQVQLQQQSAQNRQQFYSQNKGRPAVAVTARAIAFDHRMPAALPRVAAAAPAAQPRGAEPRGAEPMVRPGQAQPQGRPAEPQAQYRGQPHPEARVAQPQPGARPQPEGRPAQPQPQYRAQPQPQPEARPVRPQPQYRAQPQPQPEARPVRPSRNIVRSHNLAGSAAVQPQPRPAQPQPQSRPQPQPHPQPAAPQARPQPQHQAPPPRPEEKKDDHPHP